VQETLGPTIYNPRYKKPKWNAIPMGVKKRICVQLGEYTPVDQR
jgi:hypothetical protein